MSDFTSKGGEKIEKGDTVHTPIRGGKHEGQVSAFYISSAYPIFIALGKNTLAGLTPDRSKSS